MTVRERAYKWHVRRYGPPLRPNASAGLGAISIGGSHGLASAAVAGILFILDLRRPQILLTRLLAPRQPLPDPAVLTKQMFDCLEWHRRRLLELPEAPAGWARGDAGDGR